jgi:flagellar motor protein MotB
MKTPMVIGQHYFTWCELTEGVEGISGFQTRAKSKAITPEIDKAIKKFCTEYGLPRSLKHLESRADKIPPEELQKAPVAVHYFAISAEMRGLTRMVLAENQRGGGNFFAHTLVFPVQMLEPLDYNPFQVIRPDIFQDRAGTAGKELFDLPRFPDSADRHLLPQFAEPMSAAVRQVLEALTVKPEDQRPVIICSAQADELPRIIEAVVQVLPMEYRPGVTFSTYEVDPYRLRSVSGDANLGQRIIGTLPPQEGGKFEFQEDEYLSRYYIFNLAEQRSSEVSSTIPEYGRLAAETLQTGKWRGLETAHQLFSALEIAPSPGDWGPALPAAALLTPDKAMSPEDWRLTKQALIAVCRVASQARAGLSLLWRRGANAMSTMSSPALRDVAAGTEVLVNIADSGEEAPREERPAAGRGSVRSFLLPLALVIISIGLTWTYTNSRYDEQVTRLQKEVQILKTAARIPAGTPVAPAKTAPAPALATATATPAPGTHAALAAMNQVLAVDGVNRKIQDKQVVVSFDPGLFQQGDALTAGGRAVLDRLKTPLASLKDKMRIEVEGRTDNLAVSRKTLYADNYELGYRRALAVADYLRRTANLPAGMFRISTAGEDNPLFSNEVAEQRQKNRTVVLKIIPIF